MSDGYVLVLNAYDRLRGLRNDGGRRETLRIGPDHAPQSARLARGEFGEVLALVELPDGRKPFSVSTGNALRADWVLMFPESGARSSDGPMALCLTCSDRRLHPTFVSLLGEMVDRSARSHRPCMDELMDSLASWRAILAREKDRLSRNALIGLFGEVTILCEIAERDPMAALAAWRGPDQAPHDFQRVNALEVKTMTGTGAPVVGIHGLTQLDPPHGGTLHLVALRVEESDEGTTLGELFDRAASLGIPHSTLLDRAGVRALDGDERRLIVAEARVFKVDDDFPGLRASRLSQAQLAGVEDVRFSLQLDACPGERPAEELSEILEGL